MSNLFCCFVFAAAFKEHYKQTFRRFGSLIHTLSIALFNFSRRQRIQRLQIEYNACARTGIRLVSNLDVLDSTDVFRCFQTDQIKFRQDLDRNQTEFRQCLDDLEIIQVEIRQNLDQSLEQIQTEFRQNLDKNLDRHYLDKFQM